MRSWAAVLSVAILAACTAAPAPPPALRVVLAPDLAMTLPPPSELGRELHVAHLVTARYGDRVAGFEGHIDAASGHFRLAVLDPLGRKALVVDWTDADLAFDAAPWFPAGLRPQNMLADLVLIYWPPEVLQRALRPAGFTATAAQRSVTRDGQEIIRADFTPGPGADPIGARVVFRNLAFGYSLDIRAAGLAP